MNPIIIIPARLASTRLPGKPLADIGGQPMIVHVLRRALAARWEDRPIRTVVACDGAAIKQAVEAAGGEAVVTPPDLPSGSDRVCAALADVDPERRHDVAVNVQGDMPGFDPSVLASALALLRDPRVDIATLAAPLAGAREQDDPAVVKAVIDFSDDGKTGRALDFHRHGAAGAYHHIGIYAYRRAALERFCSLPPTRSEHERSLEQMRALDHGMRIGIAVVDTVPLGVDTPEGLEKARKLLAVVSP